MSTLCLCFFFFNDTATTEIYTLSLHDALPISDPGPGPAGRTGAVLRPGQKERRAAGELPRRQRRRSEEHTSELQSLAYLVCRLLLEKKKKKKTRPPSLCTHSQYRGNLLPLDTR